MLHSKKLTATCLVGLTMVLAVAGFAWACSPAQDIHVTSITAPDGSVSVVPNGGRVTAIPGSALQIQLRNGMQTGAQIHWNDINGPLLASAPSANSSVSALVPAGVAPGVYFVVAIAKDASGQILGKATTTVAVASSPASAASASPISSDLWRGLSSGPSTSLIQQVPTSTRSSSMTLGLGLLGAGALALSAGFVMAVSRSRQTRKAG